MAEGGAAAVGSDEPVVGSSEVRRFEERIRELERLLGRKTKEVEILQEALAKAQAKTELAARVAAERRFPMKRTADVLGVARSHLHEPVRRPATPRGYYCKAADEEFLPLIERLAGERPTYGYGRVSACRKLGFGSYRTAWFMVHRSRGMNGRIPGQAFSEGLPKPKPKQKEKSPPQKTPKASPPEFSASGNCQVITVFVQQKKREPFISYRQSECCLPIQNLSPA
jgi:hypothetical protein